MAKASKKQENKVEVKPIQPAILGARATEKAAIQQAAKNIYVFNVEKAATKKAIVHVLKSQYKVSPLKIRLAAVPKKRVFVRGRWGTKAGGKKAYVYLKKGDSIAL